MRNFKLDFVGVGAAKAGTTWLARCLAEHPRVCMSKQKELNYFCLQHIRPETPTNHWEGEKWLHAQFSHWATGQVRGEISPSYLVDPESPDLIKKHFPDIKIVFSFRNPVETIYSHYYEVAKRYQVPNTFEDFLNEYPMFIEYGFYYTHTKRFLSYFPVDNLHFIVFDDIHAAPAKVVRNLFKFLRVDPDYEPESLHRRINKRKAPRFNLVRDFVGNTKDLLNNHPWLWGLRNTLRKIGIHHIGDWIHEKNLTTSSFPAMKEDTRHRLSEIYAEDTTLLGQLINRDLGQWTQVTNPEKSTSR